MRLNFNVRVANYWRWRLSGSCFNLLSTNINGYRQTEQQFMIHETAVLERSHKEDGESDAQIMITDERLSPVIQVCQTNNWLPGMSRWAGAPCTGFCMRLRCLLLWIHRDEWCSALDGADVSAAVLCAWHSYRITYRLQSQWAAIALRSWLYVWAYMSRRLPFIRTLSSSSTVLSESGDRSRSFQGHVRKWSRSYLYCAQDKTKWKQTVVRLQRRYRQG